MTLAPALEEPPAPHLRLLPVRSRPPAIFGSTLGRADLCFDFGSGGAVCREAPTLGKVAGADLGADPGSGFRVTGAVSLPAAREELLTQEELLCHP
ncbi:hypothetical protein NDU88_001797 [Pleurodeles waltl]|uniref:Uncharacterized protein n=1 Tax=Pleurodeles waltl TaxID=8319 RepID=A0AAV7Q452_PLEWA|nr:hypothetical protein NDU88_001797 [Pleurodeles waltl]